MSAKDISPVSAVTANTIWSKDGSTAMARSGSGASNGMFSGQIIWLNVTR